MIYLDTHVVLWLYAPRLELLTARVRRLLEREELGISPMVLLELDCLRETGRVQAGSETILRSLQANVGLRVCDIPFARIVQAASQQTWTRDPFDGIIVGHAAAAKRQLVTKDPTILQNFSGAVW